MNLAAVIASFKTGDYTVTRPGASVFTEGRLEASDTTTLEISACVQPAEGRDLQKLPEGERAREAKLIFTETALRVRGSGHGADLVSIDGDTYEVFKAERWAELGNYYRALALKTGN